MPRPRWERWSVCRGTMQGRLAQGRLARALHSGGGAGPRVRVHAEPAGTQQGCSGIPTVVPGANRDVKHLKETGHSRAGRLGECRGRAQR